MGENMFKPEHRRYSETIFWIFHWNHTTETTDFIAFLIFAYLENAKKSRSIHLMRSNKNLYVINVSHMGDK